MAFSFSKIISLCFPSKKILKKIRYWLEAPFVSFGMFFFGILSLQKSSDIAAKIAEFVGKKISVHRLANENLSIAFPALSRSQREDILEKMWRNLGRVVGEFPHICAMTPQEIMKFVKFDQESLNYLEKMRELKTGAIIFSGHIGNWEIGPKILIAQGFKVNVVYRPLNNPAVENKTTDIRGINLIEKGPNGNRKIIAALRRGEFVIILADQRVSDGIKVEFFNREALTTTSIIRLAIRHKVPVIAAYVLRIDEKFSFLVHVSEFIGSEQLVGEGDFERFGNKIAAKDEKEKSDNNPKIIELTKKINQQLEEWIEENPDQWFWVHNRWKM